jgi:large subunit ribosomal protein L25
MSELRIDAQLRDVTGHKVKHLRKQGIVPVVIYGQDRQPINAQVDSMRLDRLIQIGGTQLIELTMTDGGLHNVLIREVQRHPVRRNPTHVDFYSVNMLVKQQVRVSVVSVGHVSGAGAGMVLLQAFSDVEIEALPADIPAHIEVDISILDGVDTTHITVADLPVMAGITYLDDPEEIVFSLVASRAEIEADEEAAADSVEPEIVGRRAAEDVE